MPGFSTWLKTQRHRGDPVGDLALDAIRDRRRKPRTLAGWRSLLHARGASSGALEALARAWAEWTIECGA